jgi:5-formyltetrahydrofolate cyclo-ligase
MTPSTNDKAALRAELMAARSRLSPEERREKSARACLALIESEIFVRAKTIALYAAIRGEPDPFGLEIAALDLGARVAYPRVEKDELKFCYAKKAELVPGGHYQIPEPTEAHPAAPMLEIDLFVVPGLGFSGTGSRLGYGRGYYDRVLRFARTGAGPKTSPGERRVLAVGFTFACFVKEALPQMPSDERMDALATEDGLLDLARP